MGLEDASEEDYGDSPTSDTSSVLDRPVEEQIVGA